MSQFPPREGFCDRHRLHRLPCGLCNRMKKYDDAPTVAYLIMVNRNDKTAPKLCKAAGDKLYYTKDDAKLHLDNMDSDRGGAYLAKSFGVYEVEVKVIRKI